MGAWGPGIFSNDTARDVRGEFRELIEDGLSAEDATTKLLAEWKHALDDQDKATSVWTGLAATQYQLGRLLPEVRDRTIAIIDDGGDLALWADTGPTGPRKAALEKLKAQLLGPQKKAVKVTPPPQINSPVDAGRIVAWKLPDGREALLTVLDIKTSRRGSYPIVEIVDASGRPYMQELYAPPGMKGERVEALYAVIEGRAGDVPDQSAFRLVKMQAAPRVAEPKSSAGWRALATLCMRLLDDPESRPREDWWRRFR